MIVHRREPEPGWEDRISRLMDEIKRMILLLPHERRTFGMLMSMAGVAQKFLDQHKRHFSRRIPRPKERLEDDALADTLIARYKEVLDAGIANVPLAPKEDIPLEEKEPITEARMVQIACALQHRKDEGGVQSVLFLAKMKGAKVDFNFSEFPLCPYSHGIQDHINEGLRIGVFTGYQCLKVKDRSLVAKADPELHAAIKALRPIQAGTAGEAMAAAVLFHLDRGTWGPRMYLRAIKKRWTMCKKWDKTRQLVLNILKKGHVDMSFLPARLPKDLIVPAGGKAVGTFKTIDDMIKRWWMDVHSATLKEFRRNKDIAENGLWSLWPQE